MTRWLQAGSKCCVLWAVVISVFRGWMDPYGKPCFALPGPGDSWLELGECRYETLTENLVDPSHVPFAHHGIQVCTREQSKAAARMRSVCFCLIH